MCGRYTLSTESDYQEIVDIVNEVSKNTQAGGSQHFGEIFPTNMAPVLAPINHKAAPALCRWGFPNFYSKGVLINARSESVTDKPTFRSCFATRRCVIPSTGFFEWNKAKEKFLFNLPESEVLYMAGLYNNFDGENRFVILTTAANSSMVDVHHRMPLVLPTTSIHDWLFDIDKAGTLLRQSPPLLVKSAG